MDTYEVLLVFAAGVAVGGVGIKLSAPQAPTPSERCFMKSMSDLRSAEVQYDTAEQAYNRCFGKNTTHKPKFDGPITRYTPSCLCQSPSR